MPTILDGRVARDALKKDLVTRIAELKAHGISPSLAIIQVGDRPDTVAYIKAKKSFGASIGVDVIHIHLKDSVSKEDIIIEIGKLNKDKTVVGIILQLPLPEALKVDEREIIDTINPAQTQTESRTQARSQ